MARKFITGEPPKDKHGNVDPDKYDSWEQNEIRHLTGEANPPPRTYYHGIPIHNGLKSDDYFMNCGHRPYLPNDSAGDRDRYHREMNEYMWNMGA